VRNILRGLFYNVLSLGAMLVAIWTVLAVGEDLSLRPSALSFIGAIVVVVVATALFLAGMAGTHNVGAATSEYRRGRRGG
jgi:hypothetical protein